MITRKEFQLAISDMDLGQLDDLLKALHDRRRSLRERDANAEANWSPDEVERLVWLWLYTEKSMRRIARELGREPGSVSGKIHRLHYRGPYFLTPRAEAKLKRNSQDKLQAAR